MTPRRIAVIDIGKTNAKLALVDGEDLSEIAVLTRPNSVLPGPPYPHFDVEGHWAFLLDTLAAFQSEHGIDAISVTTHGASGALIGADKGLAAPILDYEHGLEDTAEAYDALRPPFAETGAPRLPGGLNLGAQIHYQFAQDPSLRDRVQAIITYPQYWGLRLTGVLASDLSSIGCHTDLWNPFTGQFSALVERLGIADKMVPARNPADRLGPLLPEIAARTGMAADTPVYCGIHDSNASLLPHVLGRRPPFSVVSTGTWVIVMTMGGAEIALDPARDTLVNVNALGAPVPSARFMGGREYELVDARAPMDDTVLAATAKDGPLLLPAIVPDSGPFQGRAAQWIGPEASAKSPTRAAAVGYYLALMTAECLRLTGHRGTIVVEGPFKENPAYLAMLAAATDCPIAPSEGSTGTSQGAAMLALDSPRAAEPAPAMAPPKHADLLKAYAARWREALTG